VQLDELRLKVRGKTEAAWLWVACDARTKLIPTFTLGPRSQALAHHLVHPAPLRFRDYSELAQRLAPGCLPVFSSDGLTLYFYALTAHFGAWVHHIGERQRAWTVNVHLLYAQVIKRYTCPNCGAGRLAPAGRGSRPERGAGCRRRLAKVRRHISARRMSFARSWGCRPQVSGRIQTAFVERLNLTIRRSIAGLARRSWSVAHSLSELALHFDGWRAYYHFVRPHASLRQRLPENPARRTPAQAAGLTDHRWTVQELLAYPAPPLIVE